MAMSLVGRGGSGGTPARHLLTKLLLKMGRGGGGGGENSTGRTTSLDGRKGVCIWDGKGICSFRFPWKKGFLRQRVAVSAHIPPQGLRNSFRFVKTRRKQELAVKFGIMDTEHADGRGNIRGGKLGKKQIWGGKKGGKKPNLV